MSTKLTIKVHTNLLQDLVQERTQRNKYQVNDLLKYAGAYYVLRSVTTCGVIQDYCRQREDLCKYLNCTLPTLYKYLRNCEKLGFLKRISGNIVLKSMSGFAETFDQVLTQHTTIEFDFTKHKFYHVLESAYLQVKERERSQTFESRMKSQPELIRELETVVSPDKKGNYAASLQQAQIHAFKHGHQKLYELFLLNPFNSCNSKTLRELFKFKSEQSVAYLKFKLQKANLCKVTPVRVPSLKTQRVRHLFIDWDNKTKQTIWVMPDKWEHASIKVF